MTAVRIRRRTLGKRCQVCKKTTHYLVVYRLGGRGFPELTAGTFHKLEEAQTRRDIVAGEIAALRDPRLLLDAMRQPPARTRSYREWAAAYIASRIDLSPNRVRNIGVALKALDPIFGSHDPHQFTVASQIEAVAALAATRAPSTVREYWNHHRLIMDFAGVTPNPARDPAVKLPKVIRSEVTPPTAPEVLAILDKTPTRRRLELITLEQTGMAANELCSLVWGDVDEANSRFRLKRANVKGGIRSRARMIQVPDWLMSLIGASCPLEDRTTVRRVFQGSTPHGLGVAMSRACAAAGVPSYSPHDLRHRRLSLWHGQGIPARELAARAGHSQSSMTLDVYSHVLVDPTEIQPDQFEAMLHG